MAKNPRVSITLREEDHAVLQRLSAVNGESMSSIVAGLVEAVTPALARVADVAEAAQSAMPEVLDELQRVVEDGEAVLAPYLTGGKDRFFDATQEVLDVLETGQAPRRCNNGGRIA